MKVKRDYIRVDYGDPHKVRSREILARHPEVRALFGPTTSTFFFSLIFVAVQLYLGVLSRNFFWWQILLLSYFAGAILNHALFVMIHECTHNLVFKSTVLNRLLGVFCNLPIVVPMAMSFRKYHLLHHKFQGHRGYDADLPTLIEAKFVHNSPFRKTVWLLFFTFIEGIVRPAALKTVKLFDRWTYFNLLTQIIFVLAFSQVFGWMVFPYLILSTFFSVGLHPLGARWIQEHFVVKPN